MRIVVSGASGLIGSAIVPALERAGHDVVRLVRHEPQGPKELSWDPAVGSIDAAGLAGADAVVNLNGATIGRRWTVSR
jgi:NAD dependent epimerase/dehydratase family enzyme